MGDDLRRVASKNDRCQRGRDPVVRDDGSIEIPLTHGRVSIVCADSYIMVSGKFWSARWSRKTRSFYAISNGPTCAIHRPTLLLHRVVLGAPRGSQVDHINHDTLDNRLDNLRLANTSENKRNARPYSGGSSRFKGVYWNSRDRRWLSRITINGKVCHIGTFTVEEAAALAYDAAAQQHFGQHAHTNAMAGLLPTVQGAVA